MNDETTATAEAEATATATATSAPATDTQRPTLGRIVMFTTVAGVVWPAIVTDVVTAEDGAHWLALTAFPPGTSPYPARHVPHDLKRGPHTWHWPDRT